MAADELWRILATATGLYRDLDGAYTREIKAHRHLLPQSRDREKRGQIKIDYVCTTEMTAV
jgi:hypothetical protein